MRPDVRKRPRPDVIKRSVTLLQAALLRGNGCRVRSGHWSTVWLAEPRSYPLSAAPRHQSPP